MNTLIADTVSHQVVVDVDNFDEIIRIINQKNNKDKTILLVNECPCTQEKWVALSSKLNQHVKKATIVGGGIIINLNGVT